MIPCPRCDRHIPNLEPGTTCPFCELAAEQAEADQAEADQAEEDQAQSGGRKKLIIVGIGVGLTVAAATAYVLIDDKDSEFQNAHQPVYGAVITF